MPLNIPNEVGSHPKDQKSLISVNNSTILELGSDEVFIGVMDVVTQHPAHNVMLKTDQDSATNGLSFQWSPDGANWDHIQNHTVTANIPFTTQLMKEGKFFRVVYTNGSTPQGFFRLQIILSNVPSTSEIQQLKDIIDDTGDALLVRAVLSAKTPAGPYININATNGGNLKFSLEELESGISVNLNTQLKITPFNSVGKEIVQPLTSFGDLRTAELSPQFQGSFEYTVDNTDLNTNTEVNGGTVTQANGMGVMSTSTTTASTALFSSKQHARYRSGLGAVVRFSALFTTPVATTEQYIGLADEIGSSAAFKNGYMIGYDGTTFGLHRFQNDSKISVNQTAWDDPLDGTGPSGMTLDQTKLNVFFIQYQYLGAGPIHLFVEMPDGQSMLVHTIQYPNLFTEPSTHNPNFHYMMWVNNAGTTSDLILKSASYSYFVEGKTDLIELHQPINASGKVEKTSVSTEVAIFTIRNKSIYASKTNFIDILILGAGASIDAAAANNLGAVRIVKNATLGGVPAWSNINTTNSVIEIDITGTTVSGGKELGAGLLSGQNDALRVPIVQDKVILNPGDTLTIAGSSAPNNATIDAQMTWRELF